MTKVIRWTARIISLLIVSLILLFFFAHLIGGLINPEEGFKFKSMSTRSIASFVSVGIMTLGLLIAWKHELGGGVIVMASYLSFIALVLRALDTWVFLICFLCGILFIVCWYSDRKKSHGQLEGEHT
jgi:formate hydrogenlyase subunit 3/multisubunit Na+/H+ antiporter MnhD subunit